MKVAVCVSFIALVTKRKFSSTAKLPDFKSVFVSILTCGHKILGNDWKNIILNASDRDGIFARSPLCDNSRQSQCRIKVTRGPQHFKSAEPQVKKTPQHLLKHKVCEQGIRATSFNLCMLFPVRIVKWQSECIMLITSVARWLWARSSKWCRKKLLDFAESLVTNFQLKSPKSSKIMFKKSVIFKMIKRNL